MAPADLLIFDKATALLDAIVDEYAGRAEDPPERRYVTTGPVALDCCDTLAVSVGRVFLGLPASPSDGRLQRSAADAATTVEITVVLARKIPVVDDPREVPDPVEMTASAQTTARDAWLLVDGMRARVLAGLFEPCTDVALGDCTPLENLGGFGGWSLVVRVQL